MTLNQLTSEIAHSVQQQDSIPVRRAIKLSILHSRNQLIRHSYTNHSYIDRGLQQKFSCGLIDIPDGDLIINGSRFDNPTKIKRTGNKVPKPVRLTNNLPFSSVRTVGVDNPVEIAFVRTASSKFYASLPGFGTPVTYDYLNDYIYIDITKTDKFNNLTMIEIEAPFEYPNLVKEVDGIDLDRITPAQMDKLLELDDNEFLIPEDMVNDIKKLVLETFNAQVIRQTDEVPSQLKAQ